MTVESLWYVLKPGPSSQFDDICFEATHAQIRLQYLGGLDPAQIVAAFLDGSEASAAASGLLAKRDLKSKK